MKPGTVVKLDSDGRVGTVVYHNLDGYGIIWGEHAVDENDLPEPEAMLRDPYPGAEYECVGEDYEILFSTAGLGRMASMIDEVAVERHLDLVASCQFCGTKVHSAEEALAHITECAGH